MSTREHINLKTKLAAAICELLAIPHDHAKLMSEDQCLSLVQWDHYPNLKTDGGSDEHFNLVPRTIMEHREKTAKIDVPAVAKGKRIRLAEAKHAAVMAAKTGQIERLAEALAPLADPKRARPKRKIQSRGFDKGHRPLRSRNTFDRRAP